MVERRNLGLNEYIERMIDVWHGTIFGASLKNAYENGTSYEGICDMLDVDYEDYMED